VFETRLKRMEYILEPHLAARCGRRIIDRQYTYMLVAVPELHVEELAIQWSKLLHQILSLPDPM